MYDKGSRRVSAFLKNKNKGGVGFLPYQITTCNVNTIKIKTVVWAQG